MTNPLNRRRRFLSVQETASELNVCSKTIYRLIKAGSLPAIRVGKSIRISSEDLHRYINATRWRVR